MTYTDEEIELAVRGAKWCGYYITCDDDVSGALFVALLDKCHSETMRLTMWLDEVDWRFGVDDREFSSHKNRTIALLLALDAACYLPESTP